MNAVQRPPARDPRGPSEDVARREPMARPPSRPRRIGLYLGAFGATMREARNRKGLPQAEIAHRLSVSLRTYRTWESGRDAIPTNHLKAVCELLDLPRDEAARIGLIAETAEEAVLLSRFRVATADERQAALKAVCP